jgi:hypothetical protein
MYKKVSGLTGFSIALAVDQPGVSCMLKFSTRFVRLRDISLDFAKITETRPELTLLWSQGDAALSRVSPGEA